MGKEGAMKLLLIAAMVMGAAMAFGGEVKLSKEQRATKLKVEIAKMERFFRDAEKELAIKVKNGDQQGIDSHNEAVKIYGARLPEAKLEHDWLTGKATVATVEAKVKAAEEAVKKAEESKADDKTLAPLKAAVEAAKKELASIKAWEEKETVKKDF